MAKNHLLTTYGCSTKNKMHPFDMGMLKCIGLSYNQEKVSLGREIGDLHKL